MAATVEQLGVGVREGVGLACVGIFEMDLCLVQLLQFRQIPALRKLFFGSPSRPTSE